MIELGSNWAYYSTVFSSMAQIANMTARVTMVEPRLGAMRAGQNNFALNGLCPSEMSGAQLDAA